MILTVENATRVFEDENLEEKEVLVIRDFIDIIGTGALKACKAKKIYIPKTHLSNGIMCELIKDIEIEGIRY